MTSNAWAVLGVWPGWVVHQVADRGGDGWARCLGSLFPGREPLVTSHNAIIGGTHLREHKEHSIRRQSTTLHQPPADRTTHH